MKLKPGDLTDLPPGGVLAIDPGFSGGIAYVWDIGKAAAWDMPETEDEIWDLVLALSQLAKIAVVEAVGPRKRPGEAFQAGIASTFKFGMAYGFVRMAVTAAKITRHRVAPVDWQRQLGCMTKGDKKISRAKALELFPKTQNKITHSTADAILIGEYGRRIYILGQVKTKRPPNKRRIQVPTAVKKHKRLALTG